jgi:signal transduction histidine kinase
MAIERDARHLGSVRACWTRGRGRGPWRLALPLFLAAAVLWAASGAIARRLARPLWQISSVARDLGGGKLSSRAPVSHGDAAEVRTVAQSINDMADRIEKQLSDQRVLLAAVSHELRTPLARIRILVELVRENGAEENTLSELEREVIEIDHLVGELLASSRLDFTALKPMRLDAVELARRALERVGAAPPGALQVQAPQTSLVGDATLLARALANLVDNAARHGGGLVSLRVREREGFITFEAEDNGPGFAPGDEERVFQPFYRGARQASDVGSLGLGLALVRRIAQAHGGSAFARNRPDGGACVGFEVKVNGFSAETQAIAPAAGSEPLRPA